jgi:hypothetical protein
MRREKRWKLKLVTFLIVFTYLLYLVFTFTYESLLFQYEVSCGTWFKPCKEYAAQPLEVNKVMGLLEIRGILSILALIAWIGVSRYVGLV